MQRIGGACVELGQAQVEVACSVVLAVDEQGAHSNHFGCRGHPSQRIDNQCLAQAHALTGQVHAQAGEDHYWLVVAARAVRQPLRGGRGGDRPGGHRVVAHHLLPLVSLFAHHIDARSAGLVRLQRMPDQPFGLGGRSAVKASHHVTPGQRGNRAERPGHRPAWAGGGSVASRSSTVGADSSSRRPGTSAAGRDRA